MQALAEIEKLLPDVVVLDIALPDMSGVEVARKIAGLHPGARIVALSGYTERAFVQEMLKAGARAYVVKSAGADELISAIRAVIAGHDFLSPEVTRMMMSAAPVDEDAAPPVTVLGPREREVLRLLAAGLRSAEIAIELDISRLTVDVHRRNIRKKLGLHTTAELTRYAVREGLRIL